MSKASDEPLSTEVQIALAHTQPSVRGALTLFFELDRRFARIVAATSEPMLGQMRLAWWRDMLGKPIDERPTGDVVLDKIGEHWLTREEALISLVDGWEQMLAEPPLTEDHAHLFVAGRQDALLAAYGKPPGLINGWEAYVAAARYWIFADLASNVSSTEERELLIELGMANGKSSPRLPSGARGLAVLGALGRRSLKRGGRPMMEGRTASIIATRAAILGR